MVLGGQLPGRVGRRWFFYFLEKTHFMGLFYVYLNKMNSSLYMAVNSKSAKAEEFLHETCHKLEIWTRASAVDSITADRKFYPIKDWRILI